MGFRDDERAQSVQIGAVLLFAILIVAFSSYQAFVVPEQNREVEFDHNQKVQRDMVEVRNTVLSTVADGTDGYAEVTLGTRFPARLVALNPPPPSGSFATTERRPIVIREQGGPEITDEVCPGTDIGTRFLEYRPSYSELDGAGTIRYESSLLYHDFGDGVVELTGQSLVNGDRLQVIPITGQTHVGGSQTITVEPKAGRLDTSQRSDVEVKLPTRLSEQRWEEILDGEVAASDVAVTRGDAGRNVTLTLDGQRTIECGPVGIGQVPPSGARGTGGNDINPAAPGDLTLDDEFLKGGSKSNLILRFNNSAGANNITRARINFYQSMEGGNNEPTKADISRDGGPTSATLEFRADFATLDPKIELAGETTTDVSLNFYSDRNADPTLSRDSWFVVTLVLETGQRATYFVPVAA